MGKLASSQLTRPRRVRRNKRHVAASQRVPLPIVVNVHVTICKKNSQGQRAALTPSLTAIRTTELVLRVLVKVPARLRELQLEVRGGEGGEPEHGEEGGGAHRGVFAVG